MFNILRNRVENTLISNIMWSFLAKVLAMLFYFIADIFYARFLGIDAYAEWVFFFSVANIFFRIGWFGINISSKVHITKSSERERCFGAALCVRLGISSVLFLFIMVFSPLIAERIGYPEPYLNLRTLMYIMGGMVFLNSFTEFFKHFYIGIEEHKNLCMVTFVEYFSYCFFTIGLLFINNNSISIAAGYCIAGGVVLVYNIRKVLQKYDWKRVCQGIKDIRLVQAILKYAIPLVLTSLGSLVLLEMDTFMLGLFGTKEQVSVYSIAKQLVSKATNVNMAIWTGTVASLAMITKDNFEEKRTKFSKVNRLNNAVSIFVCICFFLFGRISIQFVYGSEYMEAGNVLLLLIPYYFLYCMSSLYANFLDFMGHAKTRALWFSTVIGINLTFNYLLIPKYGAIGAAVATTVSLIPYAVFCLYAVWTIFKKKAIRFLE
ncbi:MAG: flippase [Lachnospiraceae bacterium]|nr:flippase [Lachnospiraceae bacterium]